MQEAHYPDKIVTTFYTAKDAKAMEQKLQEAAAEARAGGATKVLQRPVDVYGPCPCGSGKKFKFCCRNKAR